MRDNCAAMTHTSSRVLDRFPPTPALTCAREMPHVAYIVDIDDQIQLHDYIFSPSFKWFIALNLNGEYIYRQ